ncbi:hypothetical protein [Actinoplanes sp. NPDC049265]|uniref:hypothetical protein n=1 Tax=Actinoplanes sp. NPDC049265 TaxID=3363902 RepID=UPI0037224A74
MYWPLLRPLAIGVPALLAYLWFLSRVAHGGKGWPRRRSAARTSRRWFAGMCVVAVAVAVAVLAATAIPALLGDRNPPQAESTVAVGATRAVGGIILGDGEYSNLGDYDNVCLVIMFEDQLIPYSSNMALDCHRSTGAYRFPTLRIRALRNGCGEYWTRVSAYRDHRLVHNENSARRAWCPQDRP